MRFRSFPVTLVEKMCKGQIPPFGFALWEFGLKALILSPSLHFKSVFPWAFPKISPESSPPPHWIRIIGDLAQGFDLESVFAFQKSCLVNLTKKMRKGQVPPFGFALLEFRLKAFVLRPFFARGLLHVLMASQIYARVRRVSVDS